MKKYIVFGISFILLFSIFRLLSGILPTLMYTPDMTEAWNESARLSQEVVMTTRHSHFLLQLFSVFLPASIAYMIQKKVTRSGTVNK